VYRGYFRKYLLERIERSVMEVYGGGSKECLQSVLKRGGFYYPYPPFLVPA
tara:strand:+ start:896 stop:1048 length:153 start_codon:yes stop_codon:yes gene_type:complete